MKSKMLILTLLLVFSITGNALGQEIQKQLQQVLEEIDRVENELSKELKVLETSLQRTEQRFSKISDDLSEIKTLRENIEQKYKAMLQSEANLKAFKEKIERNTTIIALLEAKILELDKDQTRIESDVKSSQGIVTWVTLIVTVVVILIGLFFSKHFLDLYANYKVLSSRINEGSGSLRKSSPIGIGTSIAERPGHVSGGSAE